MKQIEIIKFFQDEWIKLIYLLLIVKIVNWTIRTEYRNIKLKSLNLWKYKTYFIFMYVLFL